MTKRSYGRTKSGRTIDDEFIDQLATEAENGFDVDAIVSRRSKRRRAPLGRRSVSEWPSR